MIQIIELDCNRRELGIYVPFVASTYVPKTRDWLS